MIKSSTDQVLRTSRLITDSSSPMALVSEMPSSTPQSERENATQSDAEFYTHIAITLWQTVAPVLLVCGSFGNVMIILVMKRMMAASSSSTACWSLCFIALAVSDLAIVTSLLERWLTRILHTPNLKDISSFTCKVIPFYRFTCNLTSVWFLVAVTCQRVTSVLWPHRVATMWTLGRGKMVVGTVVVASCLINGQILFTYDLLPVNNSSQEYACQVVSHKTVRYFQENVFMWLDLCLASLLPFLILLIGNVLLVRSIFNSTKLTEGLTQGTVRHALRSRASQVSSITMTLILTSSAFLVLTLPVCVYQVYASTIYFVSDNQTSEDFLAKLDIVHAVCSLLWHSNSCVNFFLYCISGSTFRAEMKRLLCGRQDSVKRQSTVWTT